MKHFKKSENTETFNDATYEKEVLQVVEEHIVEVEQEEVKDVIGIVFGCDKLNVRKEPSKEAQVLCVLDKTSEVKIDMKANTTPDFYKVVTATGVEGYCMSKYILVK